LEGKTNQRIILKIWRANTKIERERGKNKIKVIDTKLATLQKHASPRSGVIAKVIWSPL
jgi:hypothetical protein